MRSTPADRNIWTIKSPTVVMANVLPREAACRIHAARHSTSKNPDYNDVLVLNCLSQGPHGLCTKGGQTPTTCGRYKYMPQREGGQTPFLCKAGHMRRVGIKHSSNRCGYHPWADDPPTGTVGGCCRRR